MNILKHGKNKVRKLLFLSYQNEKHLYFTGYTYIKMYSSQKSVDK